MTGPPPGVAPTVANTSVLIELLARPTYGVRVKPRMRLISTASEVPSYHSKSVTPLVAIADSLDSRETTSNGVTNTFPIGQIASALAPLKHVWHHMAPPRKMRSLVSVPGARGGNILADRGEGYSFRQR